MKHKFLSMLLAMGMMLNTGAFAVLAVDEHTETQDSAGLAVGTSDVCACDIKCTKEAANTECAVCTADVNGCTSDSAEKPITETYELLGNNSEANNSILNAGAVTLGADAYEVNGAKVQGQGTVVNVAADGTATVTTESEATITISDNAFTLSGASGNQAKLDIDVIGATTLHNGSVKYKIGMPEISFMGKTTTVALLKDPEIGDTNMTYDGSTVNLIIGRLEIRDIDSTMKVSGISITSSDRASFTIDSSNTLSGLNTGTVQVTMEEGQKLIYVDGSDNIKTITAQSRVDNLTIDSNGNVKVGGVDVTFTNGSATVGTAQSQVNKGENTNTISNTKISITELTEVPNSLKSVYGNIDALKEAMLNRVLLNNGYNRYNTMFYDIKMQTSADGNTWVDATENNFPAGGITVKLPYPSGTSGVSHDFVVTHMFTMTSTRLGTTAGNIEQPQVTELGDGIQVTFKGLSPVSVSWKDAGQISGGSVANLKSPKTGDVGVVNVISSVAERIK